MKKTQADILREEIWRTRLTPEKEARWEEQVEQVEQMEGMEGRDAQRDLEEEMRLSLALGRLSQPPLSSNFTAQVLQRIELEEKRGERAKISREHKRGLPAWRVGFGWVSRLAMAGFLFLGGFLGFQYHQRAQLAQSVAEISNAAVLPTDWLENFEVIHRLDRAAPVDEELLTMLQ